MADAPGEQATMGEPEERIIAREVVRGYLAAEKPELLEEFDVVYDDVYATIRRRQASAETETPADREDGGVRFDVAILAGTAISVACWIAVTLLKAAVKDAAKHDLPSVLDRAEEKLGTWTGNQPLVNNLRLRLQRILQEI